METVLKLPAIFQDILDNQPRGIKIEKNFKWIWVDESGNDITDKLQLLHNAKVIREASAILERYGYGIMANPAIKQIATELSLEKKERKQRVKKQ